MSATTSGVRGKVVSLLRYPVKSMLGEELSCVWLTARGLLGDRAFALISAGDGKVVSAKNPRKWPRMFEFRACYIEPTCPERAIPPVRITLPDGRVTTSTDGDIDRVLSRALERDVKLAAAAPEQPRLEEYWPDMEELPHRDTVTEESMPAGTFFDGAAVHLLTTATLGALQKACPDGRFEARRFRPNIVVQLDNPVAGFAENDWINHVLAIGEEVRLRISGPCPRCVMTTLEQSDLPADTRILRVAAQQNKAHVGVYASVVRDGLIRRGDAIRLEQ
ncbi:MAG: MOSC domain-containing protein [Planctomycetes bacterium]|nr:MOSC domain-containing protein [Planctomycetota bacterium]